MRVIIIGAGKVGYNIGKMLSYEKHDVVVIEKNEERHKIVSENLDVQVILGSGASTKVLEEAGIKEADLLVAVTEIDELNMVSCMLAKKYGVKKTIARVRNTEYVESEQFKDTSDMGIDLVINPEFVTAKEITELVEAPEALNVEFYADGKLQMLELKISSDAPVARKQLKDLNLPYRYLIVAILRDNNMLIPRGEDYILPNDILFIIAKTKEMVRIEKFLGKERKKIENVVILGGGRIGYFLAKMLEEKKISVKIIEKDKKRCNEIVRNLDSSLVLCGDGTDIDLLKEESVGDTDLFISVTEDDKLNLLVSLLAKHLGVSKTIAQIRRSDYSALMESVGVDVVVSPRELTAAAILRFIRKGKIVSVTLLGGAKAEMIEMIVPDEFRYLNKQLKDLTFPRGAIIGAIVRKNQVIIPSGDDEIRAGDRVIIFALPKAIVDVEKFFALI